jgi:hypothetical protein
MKINPAVSTKDMRRALKEAIDNAGIRGHKNAFLLDVFYGIFSYIYLGEPGTEALDLESELGKFLAKIDFSRYMGENIAYSAVLLYQKLSQKLCMRSLSEGKVTIKGETDNRELSEDDFISEDLFHMYCGSELDIPKDMLKFNAIFRTDEVSEIKTMSSYGDITKVTNIDNLFRPTKAYDIATKNLRVRNTYEVFQEAKEEIIVIQDCTLSMKHYTKELGMIKAFILNEAFKEGCAVRWLFVNTSVCETKRYSAETDVDKEQCFYGADFRFGEVLNHDYIQRRHVVVVTDGTDHYFTIPNYVNIKSLNMISIYFNKHLKNKTLAYGRFFSITGS